MKDKFLQITDDMIKAQEKLILKALRAKEYSQLAEAIAYQNGLTQAIANYEIARGSAG